MTGLGLVLGGTWLGSVGHGGLDSGLRRDDGYASWGLALGGTWLGSAGLGGLDSGLRRNDGVGGPVVRGCWLVVGGSWLVVRGWWVVVGGSRLVVRGWWFVVGGSWLVVRGWWFDSLTMGSLWAHRGIDMNGSHHART